ncbi:hypothetical protein CAUPRSCDRAFT_12397 [Caulochytrium protostelioides]|uniref:Uncharacterized protein n=1 Tax=Caulochytrium protostelioides TaxID=1555241 RepID=A0A4P9WTA6_9FUNG|nr:hypothetical protein CAUPRSCDRAFT_12397 [Caulochytrium protostelioides]
MDLAEAYQTYVPGVALPADNFIMAQRYLPLAQARCPIEKHVNVPFSEKKLDTHVESALRPLGDIRRPTENDWFDTPILPDRRLVLDSMKRVIESLGEIQSIIRKARLTYDEYTSIVGPHVKYFATDDLNRLETDLSECFWKIREHTPRKEEQYDENAHAIEEWNRIKLRYRRSIVEANAWSREDMKRPPQKSQPPLHNPDPSEGAGARSNSRLRRGPGSDSGVHTGIHTSLPSGLHNQASLRAPFDPDYLAPNPTPGDVRNS